MSLYPLPITGWSSICALGQSRAEIRAALAAGETGLGEPPDWFPYRTRCGSVPFDPAPLTGDAAPFDCRQARLGLAIAERLSQPIAAALERWGPDRVAMVLGTSTGGIDRTEAALDVARETGALPGDYDMLLQHNFYAFLQLMKRVIGAEGPSYIVSTACSSSAKVFSSAARLIGAGLADAVIVGGVDSLCRTTLFGFHSLKILAEDRCRPFGDQRPGINLGEGGALLLLEREGESSVWLRGVGESSDAHHMTSPHPEGLGARLAMERALAAAGLEPEGVDHVNAHGTGTAQNDASEARAIVGLFGSQVPVVSTKGYTGHTLGAAGAIEAVFACLAVEEQWIPPSLGADPLDPDIPAHINLERRELRVRAVLSNSFGFGGNNASVLIGGPPA